MNGYYFGDDDDDDDDVFFKRLCRGKFKGD